MADKDLQGDKTHEQQLRMLERKPDVPKKREVEAHEDDVGHNDDAHVADRDARQSEYPVSRRGMNQESRHNKHNDPPRGA